MVKKKQTQAKQAGGWFSSILTGPDTEEESSAQEASPMETHRPRMAGNMQHNQRSFGETPQRHSPEMQRGSPGMRPSAANDATPKNAPVNLPGGLDHTSKDGPPDRAEKPSKDTLNSRLAAVSSTSANQTTKSAASNPILPSPPPTAGVHATGNHPPPPQEKKPVNLMDDDPPVTPVQPSEKGARNREAVNALVGLINLAGDRVEGEAASLDPDAADRFKESPFEPIYLAVEGLFERVSKAKRLEAEARAAAERDAQAKVDDAEAKVKDAEAKASELEEKLRETEAKLREAGGKVRDLEAKAREEATRDEKARLSKVEGKRPATVADKIDPKTAAINRDHTEQLTRVREATSQIADQLSAIDRHVEYIGETLKTNQTSLTQGVEEQLSRAMVDLKAPIEQMTLAVSSQLSEIKSAVQASAIHRRKEESKRSAATSSHSPVDFHPQGHSAELTSAKAALFRVQRILSALSDGHAHETVVLSTRATEYDDDDDEARLSAAALSHGIQIHASSIGKRIQRLERIFKKAISPDNRPGGSTIMGDEDEEDGEDFWVFSEHVIKTLTAELRMERSAHQSNLTALEEAIGTKGSTANHDNDYSTVKGSLVDATPTISGRAITIRDKINRTSHENKRLKNTDWAHWTTRPDRMAPKSPMSPFQF